MRAAIYARCSTTEQQPDNQLQQLRPFVTARGWTTVAEYVDHGVSGAKDRRPALDRMMADAKRRKFDVVVVWKLDRFGRSLPHLVNAIQSLSDSGVAFQSLNEGITTDSATGRLMLGILGSFAEFERERIRERVIAGLQRAKGQGTRLGRPRVRIPREKVLAVAGWPLPEAVAELGVSRSTLKRWRKEVQKTPAIYL